MFSYYSNAFYMRRSKHECIIIARVEHFDKRTSIFPNAFEYIFHLLCCCYLLAVAIIIYYSWTNFTIRRHTTTRTLKIWIVINELFWTRDGKTATAKGERRRTYGTKTNRRLEYNCTCMCSVHYTIIEWAWYFVFSLFFLLRPNHEWNFTFKKKKTKPAKK